jgi:hypothetical protein
MMIAAADGILYFRRWPAFRQPAADYYIFTLPLPLRLLMPLLIIDTLFDY